MKNLKYIAIGILVGYVGLYVFELQQNKKSSSAKAYTFGYDESETNQ